MTRHRSYTFLAQRLRALVRCCGVAIACSMGLGFVPSPVRALSPLDFDRVVVDDASQDGEPNSPWGKGAGDIDGDGATDLLIGSQASGGLVWYKNPAWQQHRINSDSHGTDIEVVDVEGDGNNDVVAVLVSPGGLRVYKNGGAGDTWTVRTVTNRTLHDVEAGDFNKDGRPDFAARNQGGDGNYVYLYTQKSDGTFTEQLRSDLPAGEGLVVNDLDGDGDSDIVWNSIWLENTGGALSTWIHRPYTSSWHQDTFLAVCDVSGDGVKDIVAAPSEYAGGQFQISYFRSPSDPRTAGWTEVVVDSNVETVHHSVGCGDFDLDGDVDITSAEMQQGEDPDEIKIYENNGSGFSKVVIGTEGSHSMRVVDIDKDGDLDLFGANWNGAQAAVLWVNKTSAHDLPLDQWTYVQADSQRATQKFGLAARDVTGDGLKDILSGEYFYMNPGGDLTGTWTRRSMPSGDVDLLLSLEVDADALGDAVAMDSAGKVYWMEASDSLGTSWNQRQIGDMGQSDEGISTQGYSMGQIKAGGKPEVLLSVSGRLAYLEVPPNADSVGNWPITIIATTIIDQPEGVAIGDIDGDGDNDVASNVDSSSVAWWSNPEIGGGAWARHAIGSLPSQYADRVGLADLDGDGDLDLAVTVANGDNNGVYWFRSPEVKTNSWTRITVMAVPSVDTMNSMDLADMDRDGDWDLVAAEHRGSQRVFVFENSGTGTFAPWIVSSGIENHLGARLFDLDNDGDLDMVGIAWDSYEYLHVWRNDAITSSNPPPTSTFADVPFSHLYHDVIEALYQAGYTAGCATDPLRFCPEQAMNRGESAVFVERGIHSASYDPPAPTSQVFADLSLDSWAAKWVNGLWEDQYTAGCGTNPLVYCPWQGHTRAEGCVFYLRMLNGETYDPPQPTAQVFSDVPMDAWYAKWVWAAYDAGLIPACQTSPELKFCPNDPLTRAMAAYMMVKAKGLQLP